ncbi:MAG TPA: tryptophan synthase subunit alpha [Gaiellales bacterium]|nr:tryptophan synthase subunit alpha [Gaiellales bacterium]
MNLAPPVVSIYLMADGDLLDLAQAAVRGGADLLEIGIPFSDPLADGPTVQRAAQRALDGGMTTVRALELVRDLRGLVDVPLVPMTYAGPVMAYGERRFCADVAAAGANGLIVPDVPADEAGDLAAGCTEHGLDLIPLLAPTSTDARIALACAHAGGFVYLVSVAGITGARERASDRVAGLVERVRPHTPLPLLVGFGIATSEHAGAAVEAGADGVIVGSRAIEVAEEGGPGALEAFVSGIAGALASRA